MYSTAIDANINQEISIIPNYIDQNE